MIDRLLIDQLFARARAGYASGAGYKWSIDDVCLWSYFFNGKNRESLLTIGKELQAKGYKFVGLLDPTEKDDDQETI